MQLTTRESTRCCLFTVPNSRSNLVSTHTTIYFRAFQFTCSLSHLQTTLELLVGDCLDLVDCRTLALTEICSKLITSERISRILIAFSGLCSIFYFALECARLTNRKLEEKKQKNLDFPQFLCRLSSLSIANHKYSSTAATRIPSFPLIFLPTFPLFNSSLEVSRFLEDFPNRSENRFKAQIGSGDSDEN
jgi:hypothetical protein